MTNAIEKVQTEFASVVQGFGASDFTIHDQPLAPFVTFKFNNWKIRLVLELPRRDEERFWITQGRAQDAWEAACLRLWQAAVASVRARFTGVKEGVETFENAFLAHILTQDNASVSAQVYPKLCKAYRDGTELLPNAVPEGGNPDAAFKRPPAAFPTARAPRGW